jgi:hypothetical protein
VGDLTPAESLALARLLAADADLQRDAFARELADVLQRVERRLPGVLADATRGGAMASSRAAQLGRLRSNLRRLLTEAGYEDLVDVALADTLDRTLARLAEASPAYRAALAFNTTGTTPAFAATLRALIEVGRLDLLAQGDALATALWRATARGYLGADSPARLIEALGGLMNGERARAATLYDTNISIVQRVSVQTLVPTSSADVAGAGETPMVVAGDMLAIPDDQLYGYVGPVDGVVRPFCLEHLGKVYTKAEIDALDNGQLPNPFLTGGGYNCRHLWARISRFDAAADLHGTDGRLPEVEAELARVQPIARVRKGPRRLPAA